MTTESDRPLRPDLARMLVVWNPAAGTKAGLPTNATDDAALRDLLRRHGLPDDVIATASIGDARSAVRTALAEGRGPIVAAGGDGTAMVVAAELLGTDVALGILPLGSAMNLARSLDVPRELDAAAEVLAAGHARRIDVGLANGRPFLECVSVGLMAELLGEAHAIDLGQWSSFGGLVKVVARARPRRIDLRLDGRRVTSRAMVVAVANLPYTGLGLTIAPDARPDDGCFDVRIFRHFSRSELIRHLFSIAFGRRAYGPRVDQERAARVVVETPGLPCRADDFDLGRSPVELAVRPAALSVIVPEAPGVQ